MQERATDQAFVQDFIVKSLQTFVRQNLVIREKSVEECDATDVECFYCSQATKQHASG